MKTITTSKGTFIFISVPDDATDFEIVMKERMYIEFKVNGKLDEINTFESTLPKREIISTTKEITEEQAQGIVEKYHDGSFRDYVTDKLGLNWRPDISINNICLFAKESLQSLLEANDLKENNYLILKQIK